MKKKALLLVICLGALLAFAGCKNNEGSDNDKDKEDPKVTDIVNKDDAQTEDDIDDIDDEADNVDVPSDLILENTLTKGDYKVEDLVKLGKYTGVEVKLDKLTATDLLVDSQIQKAMHEAGETPEQITGRAIEIGDMVNINFTGSKDGVEFEGGAATDFYLVIGSGDFIDGFEDKLVGVNIGDTVDLALAFPENYQQADLAGQEVVFNVTVNSIIKYNVTQAFIGNNTDFDTIDAYKEAIREDLTLEYQEIMEDSKKNMLYDIILENSVISSVPQTLIDYHITDVKIYYSRTAQMYGMSLADVKAAYGLDDASFDKMAEEYANTVAKQELLFEAIVKAENIVLTEDEFNNEIDALVEQYEYPSREEFLLEQGEDIVRENILFQKVWDFLVEKAIEI